MKIIASTFILLLNAGIGSIEAFTPSSTVNTVSAIATDRNHALQLNAVSNRKDFLKNLAIVGGVSTASSFSFVQPSFADTPDGGRPESLDIDNFLRTGMLNFVAWRGSLLILIDCM